MKNALINLLKVKTIITLLSVLTLVYGFIVNKIDSEMFIPIVSMIITYYFNKDTKEVNENGDTNN